MRGARGTQEGRGKKGKGTHTPAHQGAHLDCVQVSCCCPCNVQFLPASAASVKVEGGPQGAYTCRSWTARRRGGSEEEALREREGWAVPRVGLRRGVVKGRAGVQYFVVTSLRLGRS